MPDEENIRSQLHHFSASVYFCYTNILGKLFLRKEVRFTWIYPNSAVNIKVYVCFPKSQINDPKYSEEMQLKQIQLFFDKPS